MTSSTWYELPSKTATASQTFAFNVTPMTHNNPTEIWLKE